MKRRAAGFTLVELIVVMVIIGVIAGVLSMLLAPAFQSYATVQRRANLTHHTDTALRRILGEVRAAVPNSLRVSASGANSCVEMVPTSTGGRFRKDHDTANAGSDPLDLSQPDDRFDVLTDLNPVPVAGDWVVIGNQNTDDLYANSSSTREQVKSVAAPPLPVHGPHRITLNAFKQFPYGYEGGRFGIVPGGQQAVTYYCSGAGKDANGNGTGKLERYSNYGFVAAAACPPAVTANTKVVTVATRVERCAIIYTPSSGATQQSGFVQLQLQLTEGGESATLTVGAQVENVP